MATLNPYGFVISVPEAMQPKPTILDFLLQAYMAQQQMRDSREDRALKQMEMQLRQKQIEAQTKNLERQAQEQEREAKEKEEERAGLERMAQQMRAVPEAPIREATAQAGPIMGETVNRLLGMNIPVSPKALEGIGGRMSQQMQEAGGLPGVSDPMQLGQLAMQNLPPSAWPQAAKLLQLFQPPAPKGWQAFGPVVQGKQLWRDPNTGEFHQIDVGMNPYVPVPGVGFMPNPNIPTGGGMMPPQGIAPSTVAAPGSASMYEPRPAGPADMEGMPPVGMTPPPPLEPTDIPMGGGISVTPPPVNLGSQTAPLPSQLETPPVLSQLYGDTVTPPEPSAPKVFSPADISDEEARGYLNLPTGTIASPKIVMDAKKDLAAIKTKQAEAAFGAQLRAQEKSEKDAEKKTSLLKEDTDALLTRAEKYESSFADASSKLTQAVATVEAADPLITKLQNKMPLNAQDMANLDELWVALNYDYSKALDRDSAVREPEYQRMLEAQSTLTKYRAALDMVRQGRGSSMPPETWRAMFNGINRMKTAFEDAYKSHLEELDKHVTGTGLDATRFERRLMSFRKFRQARNAPTTPASGTRPVSYKNLMEKF